MFGKERLLVITLAIFGLGSVLAALAGSSNALIGARALMGIGAAAIMPATLSIITNIFPAEERPKAIAMWSAVAGLGIAIGPLTGGLIIEHLHWGFVFLVNIPVVVLCMIGAVVLVPESRDPSSPKLDVVGAGLSIAGLTSLVWALIEAPDRGMTDPWILAAFGFAAVILTVFVAWERRVEQPMLEIDLFRNMRFTAANLSVAFAYFALMGVVYFLSAYLQTVLGNSALEAGEQMLPIAGGVILASRPSVLLTRRLGTKFTVTAGLATLAGALAMLSQLDARSGFGDVALALGLMGGGLGLALSPATEAILGALPKAKAGVGSAMNDVVREVAGTLGVAVLGSILTGAYASGMDGSVSGRPTRPPPDSAGQREPIWWLPPTTRSWTP
jgi:EmrB/QacA subfamily drug resistance transporter